MNQEVKNKIFSILKITFATALFIFVVITLYRELSGIKLVKIRWLNLVRLTVCP